MVSRFIGSRRRAWGDTLTSAASRRWLGWQAVGNRHIGAALGDSAASRRIRSRIARYPPAADRGTATSAIWKVTYLACRTTLAPILINFSGKVVIVQVFMGRGSTSRRRKLPRLYARANPPKADSEALRTLGMTFSRERPERRGRPLSGAGSTLVN